ncbi:YlbF family regulator [Virgibacillus sp. DJP39]|uniref:YlbF family regulator n=1 Tax=Virgibacillus sp. DJP39 TaxID=3409790 RepID=UPI003BB496E0
MIGTMEIVEILDRSEVLGEMILQSDVMEAYNNAQQSLNEDEKSQKLIKAFADIKNQYEDVQRFGRYHPDYSVIMKQVRTIKREMDMDDRVAAFKIAERNLQKLLDEISSNVAMSVGDMIKAPKDGAALSDGGCGCGSGSSGCGCKAS